MMNHNERITKTSNKISIIKSNLCNYSDVYIFASGTTAVAGERDNVAAKQADERNKRVTFINCAPFTDCISNINNDQVDNVKYIDVVMPMYNLIECSDNYSKKSRTLWQYHRDVPAKTIQESNSFKSKIKITGNTYYDNDIKKKVVEIAVPLKYCSDF